MTTTPSKLAVIDETYTQRVFEDLTHMEVGLDPDPLPLGPKRMNAKVALCRKHLSRCQQIYLQIADDLHRYNRTHRQLKLDFELQVQELFTNDVEVRSGRNVRDREAVAHTKLHSEREEIIRLESCIQDLEAVMSVVKAKREDLKDIQGRLRDQVKLCQEEISLGSRWGTAIPPNSNGPNLDNVPHVDTRAMEAMSNFMGDVEGDSSVSDLDKFVQQETGKAHIEEEESAPVAAVEEVTPEEEGPPEEPVGEVVLTPAKDAKELPAVTATEDDVDAFFADMDLDKAKAPSKKSEPAPVAADLDLDDLLGSII